MSKKCTSCKNLVGCTKPQRKENIACREFVEIKIVGKRADYLDSLFAFTEAMEADPRTNRVEKESEIILPDEDEFVAIIDSVLGENSMVPRDIRVDDRDLKEFPNFFSYVHDKRGAGVTPFPRQLWIATKLFAEYCADCSEPEFFDDILNCPVKMNSISEFQDHAQMLHHGVCPKCKKTRLDLIRQRKLNPYNELVLCLGQRSGKSILTSILDSYVTHRLLKAQKPTEIYGLLPNTTLSSIYVGLTFKGAVELLWNPVRELLQLSPWFCIGEGTPITMADGTTVPIERVQAGDLVKTLEGTSEVVQRFDNGIKDVLTVTLDNGAELKATTEHKIRVIRGDELLWVRTDELLPGDDVVVES